MKSRGSKICPPAGSPSMSPFTSVFGRNSEGPHPGHPPGESESTRPRVPGHRFLRGEILVASEMSSMGSRPIWGGNRRCLKRTCLLPGRKSWALRPRLMPLRPGSRLACSQCTATRQHGRPSFALCERKSPRRSRFDTRRPKSNQCALRDRTPHHGKEAPDQFQAGVRAILTGS